MNLALRDGLEAIIRGWNIYEIARGATPVVDFDFRPDITDAVAIASRLEALSQCATLLGEAEAGGERRVADRARADVAYLRALLGARAPLANYIPLTQGCEALGWPEPYLLRRCEQARDALGQLGIAWGPSTTDDLTEAQGPISAEQAAAEIRTASEAFEDAVRRACGTTATFDLSIETADVGSYWHYWLDGAASAVRLRLNVRHARFTQVRARQFALHEVLGHGFQSASIAQHCRENEVPWVRLLSVHAPQQTLLEGLAQALPLVVAAHDEPLIACVRLDHYLQLVRGNLHLAINRGDSIEDCARYARARAPFWTDEEIADLLTDRSVNPLLRSYLWSYPAGFDWFVNLIESAGPVARVLHAAYREPLTPADLEELWPEGPQIGGFREHDALGSSAQDLWIESVAGEA